MREVLDLFGGKIDSSILLTDGRGERGWILVYIFWDCWYG